MTPLSGTKNVLALSLVTVDLVPVPEPLAAMLLAAGRIAGWWTLRRAFVSLVARVATQRCE